METASGYTQTIQQLRRYYTGTQSIWEVWTRVYGSGIQEVDIVYRPGKQSANTDALSRSPLPGRTTGVVEERDSEPLVGAVKSETSSASENIPEQLSTISESPMRTLLFAKEQWKDPYLRAIHEFLEKQQLPEDLATARRIAFQAPNVYSVRQSTVLH